MSIFVGAIYYFNNFVVSLCLFLLELIKKLIKLIGTIAKLLYTTLSVVRRNILWTLRRLIGDVSRKA